MPILQVHYVEHTLLPEQKRALAQKLTEVLLDMEGGARTQAGRAFAAVMFHPLRVDDWYVGGFTDGTLVVRPGRFLVHVTIPEGYMNAAHKSEVHTAVNAAILEAAGTSGDENVGASIQVVIDEVPEGNWGAKGSTIGMASIADAVGLPKDGERYAWVKAYFEAKARFRASAGFPADTDGLLDGRASVACAKSSR